jgi:hypothetical protein
MTAAWRRGSLPTARRSNKRIVILVVAVAVLGVIVGEVAADVVGSGHAAGRVAAQSYVAEVIPVVDESTSLAGTLHLVRNGTALVDRTHLERALADLVTGTSDNNAQLQSLAVPAPTARSGRLLESALEARERGARDIAGAVALAIGPTFGTRARSGADALLVAAGQQLIAGDKDYVNFVRSLPRSSGRSRLPASRWILAPASWTASPAAAWLARLSVMPKLQVHEDLVIVALTVEPPVVRITGLPTTTTSPPTTTTSSTTTTSTTPTSTTRPGATTSSTTTSPTTTSSTTTTTTTMQLPPSGSTSVLPPTQSVSVVLVVADSGNVPISDIWASASVVPEIETGSSGKVGPAAVEHSTAVRIGRLAPGTSVVVTLPSLKVRSGRQYTLWAAIGTGKLPQGPVTQQPAGVGQLDEVRIKVASG